MRNILRYIYLIDGILLMYTFVYAYTSHFSLMLKIDKIAHIPPIYPISSFGILGLVFILTFFRPTTSSNKILRILTLISSIIVIAAIFLNAIFRIATSGILAPAILPGFPFTGGLLIHVIFEHGIGGALGLLLSMKPGLLQKAKVTILKKEK